MKSNKSKLEILEDEVPDWYGNVCPACRHPLVDGHRMNGILKCCWDCSAEVRVMFLGENGRNRYGLD